MNQVSWKDVFAAVVKYLHSKEETNLKAKEMEKWEELDEKRRYELFALNKEMLFTISSIYSLPIYIFKKCPISGRIIYLAVFHISSL